jgi:hypothetical protein
MLLSLPEGRKIHLLRSGSPKSRLYSYFVAVKVDIYQFRTFKIGWVQVNKYHIYIYIYILCDNHNGGCKWLQGGKQKVECECIYLGTEVNAGHILAQNWTQVDFILAVCSLNYLQVRWMALPHNYVPTLVHTITCLHSSTQLRAYIPPPNYLPTLFHTINCLHWSSQLMPTLVQTITSLHTATHLPAYTRPHNYVPRLIHTITCLHSSTQLTAYTRPQNYVPTLIQPITVYNRTNNYLLTIANNYLPTLHRKVTCTITCLHSSKQLPPYTRPHNYLPTLVQQLSAYTPPHSYLLTLGHKITCLNSSTQLRAYNPPPIYLPTLAHTIGCL